MSKSTKSNNKKKSGGGQSSNRQKHRAPSDSLIDLHSSSDETPPVTAPNKRAKNDNQTVMDVDQVVAEGSNTTSPLPPPEIVSPTIDSAVQQESAASQNTQLTPEISPVDPVPPTEDPIAREVIQPLPVDPNREVNNEEMNVDQPIDDQPNFSLNVGKNHYTAWAPIETFTPLKLSIPQLKNKITCLVQDLPGFIVAKIGARETKNYIVVEFNNKSGFDTLLKNEITDLPNSNFKEFVPKSISCPEIDRQILVRCIPLFIKKSELETHFAAAGKVERISMKTEGGFESAVITFDSIDAMDVYRKTLWMEFI